MKGKGLTRDGILKIHDLPLEEVSVPEWGGSVFVRTMSGRERDQFEASHLDLPKDGKLKDFRARVAALTLCDIAGKPLFTLADVEALTQKSAAALSTVFDVAARLNHLLPKDQEELTKNSKGGRKGGSGSASR